MSKTNQQHPFMEESDKIVLPPTSNRTIYNNFFKIGKFTEERNKIDALLINCLRFTLPFLILLNCLPQNQQHWLLASEEVLRASSIAFYTIVIFIKFLIVLTLFAMYQQTLFQSPMVMEIIKIFKNKLRILIEIDYHFSMFLLSLALVENIPNSLVSLLIYLFACVYLQNYINKEDLFYCSSCKSNFWFRIMITIGYLIASFQFSSPNAFTIIIYSIGMIIWFYRYGYQLYPSDISKMGMIGFLSLLTTANILIIQKYFQGGSASIQAFAIRVAISFTVILLGSNYIINQPINSNKDIKVMDIKKILNDLYMSQSQIEKVVFIFGQIQMHKVKCQNVMCELHTFDLYTQKIILNEDLWGISNILKGYFRCLYESKIEKQDKSSCLLEYFQYLFSQKNANCFKMASILCQIDQNYLDIFDRASLYDLRKNVSKLFQTKMNQLYEGKLHFEDVLTFDQHCETIEKQIKYLVKSNMKIYKHLNENEIDLNIVFARIRQNLQMEKQLNKQWVKISNNLKYHKLIRIIYFYYKQLIRNERITRKDILLMNYSQENGADQSSFNFPNKHQFDPSVLFQKETIIFTCFLEKERLLFKDVNFNFQYFLKYTKEEIASSSIEKILDGQLKQVHQARFNEWMNGNMKPSFEDAKYEIKNTECISKNRVTFPVRKYFKSFLNKQSELQFICMLRINKKNLTVCADICYQGSPNIKSTLKLERTKNELQLIDCTPESQFSNEHAIFIKDPEFEPKSQSLDIFNFKIIILIYFSLIAASLIIFHFITVNDSITLQNYSKQYITFMQCYRQPMILGTNYLMSILQIGNQTKIANQIVQLSTSFNALQSNPVIVKTLYDTNINLAETYSPVFSSFPLPTHPPTFDQIELFYVISSSTTSLRAPVNKNSQDFKTFDGFITPAYDNMINGTKHRFHQSFIDYINQIIQVQLVVEIIQISLSVCFVIVMTLKITAFLKKMKLISDAIVYFKAEDLQKIEIYWNETRLIFRQLFHRFKFQPATSKAKIHKKSGKCAKKESEEQYLNRITKNIIESKHFQNFRIVTICLVLIGTLLLLACVSGTQFSRVKKLNYLIYFENEGYLFLRYFPIATIVGYGCLSKYRSIHYPEQTTFDPFRFQESLSTMKIVGQFTYIPQVKFDDSLYFQKQRNYFFGNPCTYNPSVISAIGVNVSTCLTIINGSFSRGLTSYMREGSTKASSYMNGEIDLNASQLAEFSSSVSILSAYILDAISTWGAEYNQNLSDLISQQQILTLINFIVLFCILIVIFCCMFIRSLQHEYEFYRYMFLKMIPQYILKSDKVVKQAFINFNILQ